jgi:peptide/nickel transport system substrate-binding protein
MRITRRLAVMAAPLTMAVVLAACSGSGGGSGGSGPGGSGPAPSGPAQQGGVVSEAWGATPNFIFPLTPATNNDGYNENLVTAMWPMLVYAGDGARSIVNPDESLFSSMTWSNGDKTDTIVLKPWKWSDGTPITSRDFTFTYNLLKASDHDWIWYVPGLFPTDVASVQTPSAHTVVLNLTHSYNPSFYEEDVLSYVPLLPQHAWDKTSMAGKTGNYDQTPSGAKAVWKFLQKEGGQTSTFTTNPLWKVVDGPWTLVNFQNNGDWDYVPNKHYSGPVKPHLSRINDVPFTSDTAELDALRAGSVTIGQLPLNDLSQEAVLKAQGYSFVTQSIPGVAYILPNFYAPGVAPLIRQLYVRQAMEYLINRPQITKKVYAGDADPGNGAVPLAAGGPWVSPQEKAGGPYPYSPAKAVALLKAHGWKVTPGGTSTCQSAGSGPSDCGAGITSGEQLAFTLLYSSGSTTFDEQEAAIQSSEEQGGIKINLKPEPFNTLAANVGTCNAKSHPASTCSWQLVDEGYQPDQGLYPAGDQFFETGAPYNQGGYSDPKMNSLISATEYGSSAKAFFAYEDYANQQLPWLYLPNQSFVNAYKSNLGGFAPLNPFSGSINPEAWYFTKS